MKRPARRQRNEDGAILIFALLIITVVALVTGTLLTQSGTNLLATVGLRQVAGSAYAADAAAKVAIDDLEQGANSPDVKLPSGYSSSWVYDNNVDGTGCFGASGSGASIAPITTFTMPNVYPATGGGATSATVVCTPVTGTGIFGTANGADSYGSGRAVTVLGPGSSALDVNPQGSGNGAQFQIRGDIAVTGGIQVDHGNLFTNGSVAAGSCTPSLINAQGGVNCSAGAAVDPFASTAPPITTVPTTLGTWSGCTFQPGYYDDANALTAATSACSVSHFVSGQYYFDFHNNSSDPTYSSYAMSGGSSDVWTISKTVIGGDLTSINTIPGRCVNPIDNTGNNGVQFVFGGDSQVSLGNNAQVELCAPYNGGNPPMAIFGLDGSSGRGALSSGYASSLQQTQVIRAGSVTSSKSGNQADFKPSPSSLTDVAALATEDGKTESFSENSGNATPTLTLSGFTPGTAIPAGSLLTDAKLVVTHQESTSGTQGNPAIAPQLKVSVGTASNVDLTSSLTNTSQTSTPNTLKRDTIDLTTNSTLIKALAAAVHSGDISSFTAAFSENVKGKAAASVDFVQLKLTYYQPALRGETATAIPGNCIASGSCLLVTTGNGSSFKGAFVVQGVTYAPAAGLSLALGNQTAVVALRWGLVAKTAVLGSLNLFPFAYPVVSIPATGPGFGAAMTAVDLKVYTCTGSGPCSTAGTPALTSRVQITDPVNSTTGLVDPAPGTRQINVLSWSEQR